MPQIMKVFILVTCFGTFLTCNSGFHIKLILYVLENLEAIILPNFKEVRQDGTKHLKSFSRYRYGTCQ